MPNPPGLLVEVSGAPRGIVFFMTNVTDQEITVTLNVTGPNFPKDQDNQFPPTFDLLPGSFPDNYPSVSYEWALPPGVYSAFAQLVNGPAYLVGTGLVVTEPISGEARDPPYVPWGPSQPAPRVFDHRLRVHLAAW
jgi:hypothetical protein